MQHQLWQPRYLQGHLTQLTKCESTAWPNGQMASFEMVPSNVQKSQVQRSQYCGTSRGRDGYGEWRAVSSAEFQLQSRCSKKFQEYRDQINNLNQKQTYPINFHHLGMFQKTLSLFVPDIPCTLSHSSHMPATSQGSNPNSTFEASALPRVSGAGENFTEYVCMYVCNVM